MAFVRASVEKRKAEASKASISPINPSVQVKQAETGTSAKVSSETDDDEGKEQKTKESCGSGNVKQKTLIGPTESEGAETRVVGGGDKEEIALNKTGENETNYDVETMDNNTSEEGKAVVTDNLAIESAKEKGELLDENIASATNEIAAEKKSVPEQNVQEKPESHTDAQESAGTSQIQDAEESQRENLSTSVDMISTHDSMVEGPIMDSKSKANAETPTKETPTETIKGNQKIAEARISAPELKNSPAANKIVENLLQVEARNATAEMAFVRANLSKKLGNEEEFRAPDHGTAHDTQEGDRNVEASVEGVSQKSKPEANEGTSDTPLTETENKQTEFNNRIGENSSSVIPKDSKTGSAAGASQPQVEAVDQSTDEAFTMDKEDAGSAMPDTEVEAGETNPDAKEGAGSGENKIMIGKQDDIDPLVVDMITDSMLQIEIQNASIEMSSIPKPKRIEKKRLVEPSNAQNAPTELAIKENQQKGEVVVGKTEKDAEATQVAEDVLLEDTTIAVADIVAKEESVQDRLEETESRKEIPEITTTIEDPQEDDTKDRKGVSTKDASIAPKPQASKSKPAVGSIHVNLITDQILESEARNAITEVATIQASIAEKKLPKEMLLPQSSPESEEAKKTEEKEGVSVQSKSNDNIKVMSQTTATVEKKVVEVATAEKIADSILRREAHDAVSAVLTARKRHMNRSNALPKHQTQPHHHLLRGRITDTKENKTDDADEEDASIVSRVESNQQSNQKPIVDKAALQTVVETLINTETRAAADEMAATIQKRRLALSGEFTVQTISRRKNAKAEDALANSILSAVSDAIDETDCEHGEAAPDSKAMNVDPHQVKGEKLFQALLAVDPSAEKEDYFDPKRQTWDLSALNTDRMAMSLASDFGDEEEDVKYEYDISSSFESSEEMSLEDPEDEENSGEFEATTQSANKHHGLSSSSSKTGGGGQNRDLVASSRKASSSVPRTTDNIASIILAAMRGGNGSKEAEDLTGKERRAVVERVSQGVVNRMLDAALGDLGEILLLSSSKAAAQKAEKLQAAAQLSRSRPNDSSSRPSSLSSTLSSSRGGQIKPNNRYANFDDLSQEDEEEEKVTGDSAYAADFLMSTFNSFQSSSSSNASTTTTTTTAKFKGADHLGAVQIPIDVYIQAAEKNISGESQQIYNKMLFDAMNEEIGKRRAAILRAKTGRGSSYLRRRWQRPVGSLREAVKAQLMSQGKPVDLNAEYKSVVDDLKSSGLDMRTIPEDQLEAELGGTFADEKAIDQMVQPALSAGIKEMEMRIEESISEHHQKVVGEVSDKILWSLFGEIALELNKF